MNTRSRTIAITVLTSLLFFLGVFGLVEELLLLAGLQQEQLSEFIVAGIVSLTLLVGTWWVLYFKRKQESLLVIGAFPAAAILPYSLLADSIVGSLFGSLGQIPFALVATLIFFVSVYFLILTANALNGALLYEIPLGQVGKAAQFIFSLIATYFLLAYLFEAAFPIVVRVGFVFAFVFFFTYAGVWNLKQKFKNRWLISLAMGLIMVIAVLVLSVWPIPAIYATVASVIIFYVLLNIALETREVISQEIWLEYAVLLSLLLVILLVNAEWGILGTLL